MATAPTLLLETAWGHQPFDTGTLTWVDISEYVAPGWVVSRGVGDDLERRGVGTFSCELINEDRRFDSLLSPAIYTTVKATRRVRASMVYDLATYRIFDGYWNDLPQGHRGKTLGVVPASATDGSKFFSRLRDIKEESFSQQDTGARVSAIANLTDWPNDANFRNIDTGSSTLQAVTLTIGDAMQALHQAIQAERGLLFFGKDGRLTFISRHTLFNSSYLSPATVVGDKSWNVEDPTFLDDGLDDLSTGGSYSGSEGCQLYQVQISGVGTPDEFIYSDDGGDSWSSPIEITGSTQALNNGVTVSFGATTGHTLDDTWEFFAGEHPFHDLDEVRFGESIIYNQIKVETVDGTEQTVSDATSIGDHGTLTLPLRNCLASPTEALDLAYFLLSIYKDPVPLVSGIELVPLNSNSGLNKQLLDREIGDSIKFKRRYNDVGNPTATTLNLLGMKIEGREDGIVGQWYLGPIPDITFWKLSHVVYGILNSTTNWGV